MHYGVPQTGRTKHSNRVRILKLYADTAAEEVILTNIHDALESGNWDELVLRLKDGRELKARFDGDECPECAGRSGGYCPRCKQSR